MLIATLILFVQELSSRGGAQAWTYNYSIAPNRRWPEASEWCQQHFTGMALMRSQEETDFLNNLLPLNSRYYWIGIRKDGKDWIFEGSNIKVPEDVQNWAPQEPDTIAGQDCVEVYIKRDKDTAKWNNENCRKKKGTVCYTASCAPDPCSENAVCAETVGGYTCQCHPGFQGSHCEEAIACKELLDVERGSHYCLHPYGLNRFNSSCLFHCELGFHLVGAPQLLCQASGRWNHPVPLCQAVQCPVLDQANVSAGSLNCSHPIAPYSYNSTCEIRCDVGYEPNVQDQIRCDHAGQWTATIPTCTVKKCHPILFPVTGNMTCMDILEPFSFGSRCNFTCREGYYLRGEATLSCLASGEWSGPPPACTVVQCNRLRTPSSATMQCQDPLGEYSYGSICISQCEEGFDLIGTNVTKCSSHGNWTDALPLCQVRKCSALKSPPHGSLVCLDPREEFSFGSRCNMTCNEGFILNGTAEAECTSLGTWSADVPQCLAKRCSTLNSPSYGSLVCSDPHDSFSFGSRCTFTCNEGFVLNGTADTECTSLARWSAKIPSCLAKRCPTLNPLSGGASVCSSPHGEFHFGSRCSFTCDEGFVLDGTADTECTSLGTWSARIPYCLARPCPLLAKSPDHGRMNCSHKHSPFSFSSRCEFECSEGFLLRGASATTCNSSGRWSEDLPTCQPVQCRIIQALPLPLSMNCSHPLEKFSFGSECRFTCKDGYSLNGSKLLLCSSTGLWSGSPPECAEEGMPLGTALLMYTGIGAASVALPLLLIGLCLMLMTQVKKRGNSVISEGSVWEDRDNPAFEF